MAWKVPQARTAAMMIQRTRSVCDDLAMLWIVARDAGGVDRPRGGLSFFPASLEQFSNGSRRAQFGP